MKFFRNLKNITPTRLSLKPFPGQSHIAVSQVNIDYNAIFSPPTQFSQCLNFPQILSGLVQKGGGVVRPYFGPFLESRIEKRLYFGAFWNPELKGDPQWRQES